MTADPMHGVRGRNRWTLRAAAILAGGIMALALIGPLIAGSHTQQVGGPYQAPTWPHPLGTDALGRDVLDRVLHGGWIVVGLAVVATALATAGGLVLGVALGSVRHRVGEALMRLVDVLLVVPPVLLLLLLATGLPGSDFAVLIAVALVTTPTTVRVIRAATRRAVHVDYVDVARARGDGWWHIFRHDVAPAIARTALAEAGLRFVTAVYLTATAGFLGLGRPAPAANWGRMVSENLDGATLTAWPFLAPAMLLVVFTVAVNLLVDGVADQLARKGVA